MRVSSKMNAFRVRWVLLRVKWEFRVRWMPFVRRSSTSQPVPLSQWLSFCVHPTLIRRSPSPLLVPSARRLGAFGSFPRISSGAAPFEHINVLEFELQRDCSGEKCLIKEFGSFSHNFHPVKKRKHFNTCLPSSTMARTSRSGTRALAFF